ncbi:hypothetical protein Q669_20655 [Labrenzia sp. C1B10]|uniref:hypothetical protein n=1 Tax=unclassified Labrenzia TaxID=2648686 RepID=UPI0003B898B5|nr:MULTISPECIES: hypothetical protein [unclassified Labrenzia]ERP98383.1 hypothetical protein Q669_20655 [Labrenzia sp. C1B10]ERS01147.1 hypothetical protein Q675_32460 [Labrenzia sp. C1B70]
MPASPLILHRPETIDRAEALAVRTNLPVEDVIAIALDMFDLALRQPPQAGAQTSIWQQAANGRLPEVEKSTPGKSTPGNKQSDPSE